MLVIERERKVAKVAGIEQDNGLNESGSWKNYK